MAGELTDILNSLHPIETPPLSEAAQHIRERAHKVGRYALALIVGTIGDIGYREKVRLLESNGSHIVFKHDGEVGVMPYKDLADVVEIKQPFYRRDIRNLLGL